MGGPTGDGRCTLQRGASWALCWGVLALGVVGCEREPPALEVGPLAFSAAELGALGPEQRETLGDLSAFGLIISERWQDSLIRPETERDLRSLVLQRLAMELAARHAGLGDPELRLAYARQPRYELVVRHLVVLSERWRPVEHRDSARAVATEARERARSGEPFDRLAGEYSDEPGAAERGGLLQPGREGTWVPDFWRAASSLDVGEVSPVVETEYGFHVIRLEDRTRVPFEEVREDVLGEVMDLPLALGRAEDWAGRRMEVAEVDTGTVRAWIGGVEGRASLVRWPDSLDIPPFTAAAADSLVPAVADRSLERLPGAAQTHMMLHRARELGIEPSRSQRAAIEERWHRKVAGWATALGFGPGQSHQRVKQQALEALATPEQNAAIARSELASLSPRLRELHAVREPDDSEAGDAR